MTRTLQIGDIIRYDIEEDNDNEYVFGKVIEIFTDQWDDKLVKILWTDSDSTSESRDMAWCFEYICNIKDSDNSILGAFALQLKTGYDLTKVLNL